MSGIPVVHVEHLSHRYAKDWALKDVNFAIEKGVIVGLLGSNGAGKSTCMNIICGVLHPTKGNVQINGISIREQPLEAKRQIGFLPQQAPLHTELTVDEYLRHCAGLRGMGSRNASAAIDDVKEKCGIAHFSNRLIGALSGGYRQRVGLAQAILHGPALVVLDEPTNGLDPNQIREVRKLIKDIAVDCTVLLSTHILSEVEVMCSDIKMIEQGLIAFEGTVGDYVNMVEPRSLIAAFERLPPKEALCNVPGVEHVLFINQNKIRLTFSGGAEIAEALIVHCVKKGWRLREISLERDTLEEVFARISQTEQAV